MRPLLVSILFTLTCILPASVPQAAETDAKPPAFSDLSNPRDAGIRYGQAAGMAAVCLDMKPTAKAEALSNAFTGADLEKFKVQAETVMQSWKKTLSCAHKVDPNPCRLAHQMSCKEAFKEIGPGGSVAPGLIEMTKAQ
ncbi:MAG: hypothetical protein MUC37_01010 [Hyphomicrobium sp.]|jgi:hypothetical protein|nr:hypothetical protein [Hyphomicrobium sp.]